MPPIFSSKRMLPRETVDLVVQAEGDLAEDAGALVEVEQRLQEVAAARRLRVDDRPSSKRSRTSSTSRPVVDRREREADLALGRGLDGAREDLAVGHVDPAVGHHARAALDAEAEIGVGPEDAQLAHAGEPSGMHAELGGYERQCARGASASA